MHASSLSFECFPPRSDADAARFLASRDRLAKLAPEYMSVTFGAGGSTRERTLSTALGIQRETSVAVAPHISCMTEEVDEIRRLLTAYRQAGVRRLVVLRGDRPSGGGRGALEHASDLVGLIRREHGQSFRIDVACYPECHPESATPWEDLRHFRAKVEAGADGAITQYFYNAEAYFRFVDEVRNLGVDVPIVPGIMPITNFARLARFSRLCGAEIPLWIGKRLHAWEASGDLDSLRRFGLDVVRDLCRRLLEGGAPGLHIYTLNRAEPTLALCRELTLGQEEGVVVPC